MQKGYVGAYLQFPSANNLFRGYSGEYTCTASHPLLGTRQATAILLVHEQGQYIVTYIRIAHPARQAMARLVLSIFVLAVAIRLFFTYKLMARPCILHAWLHLLYPIALI